MFGHHRTHVLVENAVGLDPCGAGEEAAPYRRHVTWDHHDSRGRMPGGGRPMGQSDPMRNGPSHSDDELPTLSPSDPPAPSEEPMLITVDGALAAGSLIPDGRCMNVCPTCYTTVRAPNGWSLEISGEDSHAVERVALSLMQQAAHSDGGTIEEVTYGDKYVVVGGAIAVGREPVVNAVDSWNSFARCIERGDLADQLNALRRALRRLPEDDDIDSAIGALANAESAVKNGDGANALAWLGRVGTRALKIAQEIGTTLATEAIKRAMGL